jgi:ribonucleoside-diphosphate reductase alpha chain
MQGGDSCRLIAINLYNFVDEPFTKKAKFNFEKFYKITYEAQRLQDDLVDLELEAIERIMAKIESDPEPEYIKDVERKTWQLLYDNGKNGRRTGLGFTALGDAVAALGLAYDGNDSISMIENIMRTKMEAEFNSSIDMAIERGAFVGFDAAIENTSEYVHMMQKEMPEIYERMMKHGRRNISISTVAPTGTLSMLAQTSSGIEPVYLLSYTRRRKVNPSDPKAKVSFVDDLGDSWEEFTVYHPKLRQWMEVTGEKAIEGSPYYGSTAPKLTGSSGCRYKARCRNTLRTASVLP